MSDPIYKKPLEPKYLMIPIKIVRDKNLRRVDGYVYGVIYWLFQMHEKCFVSNEAIAIAIGSKNISEALKRLEENSYIKRIFNDKNKRNRDEIIPCISLKQLKKTQEEWDKDMGITKDMSKGLKEDLEVDYWRDKYYDSK